MYASITTKIGYKNNGDTDPHSIFIEKNSAVER